MLTPNPSVNLLHRLQCMTAVKAKTFIIGLIITFLLAETYWLDLSLFTLNEYVLKVFHSLSDSPNHCQL